MIVITTIIHIYDHITATHKMLPRKDGEPLALLIAAVMTLTTQARMVVILHGM